MATNAESIRAMHDWLKLRGVVVTMATARRLNVEGMQDLVKLINQHLRDE